MLDCFNFDLIDMNKKINVHENFPKDKLVDIMLPYLKLYYLSEFSFIHMSGRTKYKKILRSKLSEFQKFNPNFGRKIYEFYNILQNNRIIKKIKGVFNYKYKKFNDKNKEKKNFMNSHHSNYYCDSDNDTDNDYDNETENGSDNGNESESEELTIVQNLENRFININNNLYLINEYTEDDSESDVEYDIDELNNNIMNNLNTLNNSLFDIDSDLNNETNNDDDSIS